MNSKWKALLIGILMGLLALCIPMAAGAETSDDTDEWTVLVYMCGSDLESKYGYGTDNLKEILTCELPFDMLSLYTRETDDEDWKPYKVHYGVNLLVETGGCSEWHGEKLGIEIRNDCLQRWRFIPWIMNEESGFLEHQLQLEDEQPLANMADPNTLAEFIRWGVETCPAQKYALVLWDHGDGSRSGLFADELFGGDRMYLDELSQALADGGIIFETVIFDACLMANIETAAAIRNNARWMVASEEVVAGEGTAIGDWFQQLSYFPEATGDWLGRWVCDTTQAKYKSDIDPQTRSLLTWSVVDLSAVEELLNVYERLFAFMAKLYVDNPDVLCAYMKYATRMETFGNSSDMLDLSGLVYNAACNDAMEETLRHDMMQAQMNAVTYMSRGSGRSDARGLSVCFAAGFSKEQLDIYARNCPFPHFLALLDATTLDWEAPAKIYETVERLPEISTLEDYALTIERRIAPNGLPALAVDSKLPMVKGVYYRIFAYHEASDQIIRMGAGKTELTYDEDYANFMECIGNDPMNRPALEGSFIDIELIQMETDRYLARVPIQIDSTVWDLRVGYDREEGFTVYGLWEGYDDNSEMFSRNVKSLAQFVGQEYRILYPVYDAGEQGDRYVVGEFKPIMRWMTIEKKPIPPGIYYIQYQVVDIFNHHYTLDKVEVHWDGETVTLPEGTVWEGKLE